MPVDAPTTGTPPAPTTIGRRTARPATAAGTGDGGAGGRLPLVVYVLAVGTFLMLTTEFVVAGLLPEIAGDLQVSVAQAGLLITVFAVGMVVGAPAMALLTRRMPRRTTLVLALAVFAAGHIIVAVGSSFPLLLAARFVTAFATGAFWAVASVAATRAAGPGQLPSPRTGGRRRHARQCRRRAAGRLRRAAVELAGAVLGAGSPGPGRRAAHLAARPARGDDHRANRAYRAPRITAEFNDGAPDSERVNHKRVARVMAEHKIAGIWLRRPVRTTIPEPAGQQVPDLLERDFTAAAPNVTYVGDITYLPCGDGTNLYLATVIDCYSRRLVGWSIADHMRTELVADALRAAAAIRGSLAGAIFHSDHGCQYSARAVAGLCDHLGVVRSMGAVGSSADNALAESFNATLKRETLAGAAGWESPVHARRDVFGWITRYNSRRRHSACGQTSPTAYEAGRAPATLPTAA